MRLMENGKGDEATEEKLRLEQEQRDRRKEIGYEPEPTYFKKEFLDGDQNKVVYRFGSPRNYWEDKERKDFEHLPSYF